MAKISFSTQPQKRFYSYVKDGHIYNITSTKPNIVADEGGYWCCYFMCEPYYKHSDGLLYQLYENISGKGTGITDEDVSLVTSTSFHKGNGYLYKDNGNVYHVIETLGKYYSKNGKFSYNLPNDATELPHTDYKDYKVVTPFGDYSAGELISETTYNGLTVDNKKNVEKNTDRRYYFDTLIQNGARYAESKFTPMDIDGSHSETPATTYGDLLINLVEDAISINSFDITVSEIPVYLKGVDLSEEFTIESIGYEIPANYFVTYRQLFLKKLNKAMKELGDSIVAKYKVDGDESTIDIIDEITDGEGEVLSGIITSTPQPPYNIPGDLKGDINGDGVINNDDISLIADIAQGKGDVNGDGHVNNSDIDEIYSVIAGDKENPKADVNGDGVVNADDAVKVDEMISVNADINGDGVVDIEDIAEAVSPKKRRKTT